MSTVSQVRQQLIGSQLMTAEAADLEIARWREETDFLGWLADGRPTRY